MFGNLLGKQTQPAQSLTLARPAQAGAITMATQNDIGIGLDINSIMNLMITMMIVVMMMKMMTGAMGSVAG